MLDDCSVRTWSFDDDFSEYDAHPCRDMEIGNMKLIGFYEGMIREMGFGGLDGKGGGGWGYGFEKWVFLGN